MSSDSISLTDDQRLSLIEEALLEPFEASTKLHVIRMILDHRQPLPAEPVEPERAAADEQKIARGKRRAAASKTIEKNSNAVELLLSLLRTTVNARGVMTTEELAELAGLEKKKVYNVLVYQAKREAVVQVTPTSWKIASK